MVTIRIRGSTIVWAVILFVIVMFIRRFDFESRLRAFLNSIRGPASPESMRRKHKKARFWEEIFALCWESVHTARILLADIRLRHPEATILIEGPKEGSWAEPSTSNIDISRLDEKRRD